MQVFHILSRWILGALILLSGITLNAQTIYFVNSTANPDGDGLSWATSFTGLQQAIDSACQHAPAEIWVAHGTYYPSQNDSLNSSGPTDRTNTFSLCNNVQVYGGFQGTETVLSERDWLASLTTLSGDLDQDDSLALNAYNVVTCSGTDSTSHLDGFTITAGNADLDESSSITHSSGGGVLISDSKTIIRNCNISRNNALFGGGVGVLAGLPEFINCNINSNTVSGIFGRGGGIANYDGSHSRLQNCTIADNMATTFGGGFYNADSSDLSITHSMIINNVARRGGGIYTNNSAVHLNNCIISNNQAEDEGGAIYNLDNSTFQMDSCSLTNNQAGFSGGALFNSGSSDAILTNCRVEGNITFKGGGISNVGGAVIFIENSTISGNESESQGGGIFNASAWSTMTNCIISGNRSNGDGGGLMNEDSYCKLINCSITGNAAAEDGAGIYNASSSDPYLANCILWNNAANGDVSLITSTIYNNIGSNVNMAYCLVQNSGGSIDWDNALGTDLGNNLDQDPLFIADVDLLTLPNSTGDFHLQSGSPVINAGTLDTTGLNLPLFGPDGYLRFVHGRIDMGAYEYQGAISLPDCSISGPDLVTSYSANIYSAPAGMMSYAWSIKGNGAFFNQSDQQSVTIIAGASNSYLVTVEVTDMDLNTSICAINVNIEVDCSIYDGVEVIYVNPNATGTNSGTSWANAFTNLQDALLIDCPNVEEIWVAAGTYYPTLLIHDRLASFHLMNGLSLYGGFKGDELTLEERDYNFFITTLNGDIDQDGRLEGNVFNVVNGSGTDSSSVLDGFTIRGGNAEVVNGAFEPQSSGAGIFIINGAPTISNCHITENFAYLGAGMMNFNASPKITNCTFSDNITGMGGRGGGMFNGENSSPLLIDCTFLFNQGTLNGGGMSNQLASPVLINCTFDENEVTSNSGRGGGIFNIESSPVLMSCTFTDNNVPGNGLGGGIHNTTSSSPMLTGCIFSGNTAKRGSGMYNQNESSPILNGCIFSANETRFEGIGGGIYNQNSSNPKLTDCLFEDNFGYDYGGGMHNDGSSPVLVNCTFNRNESFEYGGGGISNINSSPVISNCIFGGNISFDGAGIFNDDFSSPALNNCTISGNQSAARGGGLFNMNNSNPTLTNCIVWNNKANEDTEAPSASIFNIDNSIPFISYSIISNSRGSQFWVDDLGVDGGDNLDTDPAFVKDFDVTVFPDSSGDLRLTLCSAAIDAGTPDTTGLNLPLVDPDGNPRIINDRIDMGAYEYIGESGLPTCLISGPDSLVSYITQVFSAPEGLASYEWTIIGNGVISGSSTEQEVTVVAGSVNSFLLVLNVEAQNGSCFSTCTLEVRIKLDCTIFGTSDVIYVDHKATGDNNGTSWSNAYTDLQNALNSNCPDINQVWVAAGSYYPSSISTDREATFQLVNNLKLYGGFVGTELTIEERDWEANQTILSGDIDSDLSLTNNTYTVVTGSGTDTTAQLDGFIITGGYSDDSGQGGDAQKSGGGMYNENGSPVLRNCNFTGNSALWRGGGMYNVNAAPILSNCIFSGNQSMDSGGGMFNDHSAAILSNCSFSGNLTEITGGGISFINGSTGRLNNCDFEGNVVSAFASGGGGINIDSSAPVLTRCFIKNNSALEGIGGGIHIGPSAHPIFIYCTFEENQALFGGGFREHNSSSHFIGCIFRGNLASSGAGGSVTAISGSKFTNCKFIRNSATNSGGGLHGYSSSLNLLNCEFIANTSEVDGAGIWIYDSTIDAVNSIFTGNVAIQHGGGIFSNGNAKLKLTNSTISGNDAGGDGGGVYNLDSASLTMTNSIVWNNRANANTGAPSSSISNDTSSITTIAYSLVANSGGSQNWNSEIGVDLGNNLDSDPLFIEDIDLEILPDTSGDVHLMMGSPAINAGTPDTTGLNLPVVDADDNPRLHAGRIDMGAYEYQGIVSIPSGPHDYLSLLLYPNPAHDFLFFTTEAKQGEASITNSFGQIISTYPEMIPGARQIYKLDIAGLAPGVYILEFQGSNGGISSGKFVVVN